jgi:glutathione peroxidase
MSSIYDFKLTKRNGEEFSLSEYKGKVMIIVNTATGCGFTPHYEPLEKMYEDLHDSGLEIIDVPCNQFGNQTPGTDNEVHEFCTLKYNTKFDQFKKSDVNGENALPLFTFLKSQQGFKGFKGKGATMMKMVSKMRDAKYKENPDIKWNFTKFLVDREGNVVARFEPTESLDDLRKAVEELLAK